MLSLGTDTWGTLESLGIVFVVGRANGVKWRFWSNAGFIFRHEYSKRFDFGLNRAQEAYLSKNNIELRSRHFNSLQNSVFEDFKVVTSNSHNLIRSWCSSCLENTMLSILDPVELGDTLSLRNRICMGSMTRNRCIEDNKPTAASRIHYAERARDGVGMIVAEGTFIHYNGSEWPHAPVILDRSHAKAWKEVTDAVHQENGKILFQPWHPGRIQNENMPMLKKSGYPVLAPSRVKAAGGKFRTLEGVPGYTENITEIEDPQEIVEQYRRSVALAKEARFDGIELLSQGGYLLHNFLCSHANKRTDQYGGSAENRCRFPLEVLDAILTIWSPRVVGVKICPPDDYNDSAVSYEEIQETYSYYISELMKRDLGFINLSRRGCEVERETDEHFRSAPRPKGKELPPGYDPVVEFGPMIKRPNSNTMLMVNHEYTVDEADGLIRNGKLDLVTFARPFIYNPDLISRITKGIPFATNDRGGKVNYGPYKDANDDYNDWPCAKLA